MRLEGEGEVGTLLWSFYFILTTAHAAMAVWVCLVDTMARPVWLDWFCMYTTPHNDPSIVRFSILRTLQLVLGFNGVTVLQRKSWRGSRFPSFPIQTSFELYFGCTLQVPR